MKLILLSLALIFSLKTTFCQTNYTFVGHGLWSNPSNWFNNSIPPAVLPAFSSIYIYSSIGDSCILNTDQTINLGSSLNQQRLKFVVLSGVNFKIFGKVNFINTNDSSVIICNQEWKVRNLDVEKYRNGDLIPQVTDPTVWGNLTTGAWCYINDNPANGAEYGKLYNWYAVNDPRGLAPQGWHVPSELEFLALSNCLGGDAISGGKMKETGLIHWANPNTGASNSSGFTALPGGLRNFNGVGSGTSLTQGLFWTSSSVSSANAWSGYLYSNNSTFIRDINNQHYGFSVRCVKD
jgi:uncharacterized protein (TIGR02145 family)